MPPVPRAIHRYRASCHWKGTTASGYEGYSRAHAVTFPGAAAGLTLSADSAFLGDPALHNPEQLLLAAAMSCQLLSFLAVAARARVAVLGYRDQAEAELPERPRQMRVTRITLRPRIQLAAGTSLVRARKLVAQAHAECFIANTLNCELTVEPTFDLEA